MKYCKSCLYPETAKPTIYFNDDDETFTDKYKHLYFNENNPPTKTGKPILDNFPIDFEWS